MATNRLTIKQDGLKVLVTSNDPNIKQVFFGWASYGTGLGVKEYPEFYGRQTEGDGSSGPDNNMWLWTLNFSLVAKMIENLDHHDKPIAGVWHPPTAEEQKADAYVLRAFKAFIDCEPVVELDEFTVAYITAALWSTNDESTPEGGEPLDNNYGPDDIAPEAMLKIKTSCAAFQEEHKELLTQSYKLYESRDGHTGAALAGHDLWFDSNGHGVGYRDRDLGEVGELLSKAAKEFGESWIEVGDDGKLYGF